MMRILVFCIFLPLVTNAEPASFNCKKTITTVENIICTDSHLSFLDNLLSRYYKQSIDISPNSQSIKDSQRQWLKEIRNKCLDIVCLKSAYNERLAILKMILLSKMANNADFTGIYESKNGELLIEKLPGRKIKFDLFVFGPYDKNKSFSPKSNQIDGEIFLVGDTATYNEDGDCNAIFIFLNNSIHVIEYGCWIYAISATGNYKLKSKNIGLIHK